MIEDLDRLGPGPAVEADLCIIGAGAAGISIARAFANTRFRVCLVESGGLGPESETQALYDGVSIGLPHSGMSIGRLRYFGGTTNHWGGRCAGLDELDFRYRDWVPHSGWPFGRGELAPYYEGARILCGILPEQTAEDLLGRLEVDAPALRPDRLRLQLWQYTTGKGPWSFGRVYRSEIDAADNVAVLLHANLTRIRTNPGRSRVEAVTVASLEGTRRQVKARVYVLCCGAIENARLLLGACDPERRPLGNRRDLVGRFYMEHARGETAVVATPTRTPPIEQVFNFHDWSGIQHQIGLALSPAAQEREELLNCSAILDYVGDPNSGVTAGQAIWRGLQHGHWPDALGEKVWNVISDFDLVAETIRRRLVDKRRPIMPLSSAAVVVDVEQAPNPDSRVRLLAERDSLGLPKAQLCWRLTDQEQRTAEYFTRALGTELLRLGLGRMRLDPWLSERSESSVANLEETFHQMGTTRMSADPSEGVVDPHCRVHEIANLYVGGSSVFPTVGHANPTLTIVALALRLAERLKTVLS
jgi:choline dehydrogenase-like flavoprotein